MKKFISILLVICVLITCFGCGSCSETPGTSVNESVDQVITDRYILNNGVTDYKIVLPEESNDYEESAASELSSLFNEATGVSLQTVKDTNLTHSESAKYLSIGNTNLFKSANIEVDDEATLENGFQITTKDNTIYFVGGNRHGVLFAVYEFLFRTLGFEQYSADCYGLDKAVTDIPLYIYSVVDSPDFSYAKAEAAFMNYNAGVSLRMKSPYTYEGDVDMRIDGNAEHNSLIFVKPELYKEEHEGWFSYPDASQLCYVARGDEAEYKLLVETMVESLINTIKLETNKGKFSLSIGCMDNHNVCNCSECLDIREKYGCDTAQVVWFMNDCYDKLMEWFETEEGQQYYSDNFRLKTTFYAEYIEAPAKYNEQTKKWEPIDDSVVFRDGVVPSVAPYHVNFQLSLEDPKNTTYYNQLKKIDAISKEMSIWWYCTNFSYYMYPYDNFSSMQENYQILYKMGVREFFDETQGAGQPGMTGWHMFKAFLSSRFAWNIHEDQEALTNRYFEGYFMDAAEDMLKYYNSYRNFSQIQLNGLVPNCGSLYCVIGLKEYWPKAIIDEWQGYVDSALEKIEKYKSTDPKTYDMLYKHITMERAFLDYVYMQFYKSNLGSGFDTVLDRFVESVNINNIKLIRPGVYIQDYIKTLRDE